MIDLRRQQALDPDTKSLQQINFTGNLNQPEGAFILEEVKVLWVKP